MPLWGGAWTRIFISKSEKNLNEKSKITFELLIEEGGAFPCRDREEIFEILVHLKEDEKFYREASEASRRVIVRNLGASARTVKEILGLS